MDPLKTENFYCVVYWVKGKKTTIVARKDIQYIRNADNAIHVMHNSKYYSAKILKESGENE